MVSTMNYASLKRLGNFLMDGLRRIYAIAVTPSRPWIVRHTCMTFIAALFCLRCIGLVPRLKNHKKELLVLALIWLGIGSSNLVLLALCLLFYYIATDPGDGIGHRVGAEGYDGKHFENTIEAFESLARRDAAGEFDDGTVHFPYYEIDVQETRDGELVLFHDPNLLRGFPNVGPNVEAYNALRSEGIIPVTSSIADLTFEQLSTLHLGGRKGLHVPKLADFLKACCDCNARRTLAVEVKSLQSDKARQKLIDLLSAYKSRKSQAYENASDNSIKLYPLFGWIGIIAFPQFFASAFGEFGTSKWEYWNRKLRSQEIAARCCHLHWLDLTFGADYD